jgi:hypothetical protein
MEAQYRAQQEKLAATVMAMMPKGYSISTPFSVTDYGMSAYVCVFDANYTQIAKFRISDHSVQNVDRMRNEIHFSGCADRDYSSAVEYALFPERFQIISKSISTGEFVEQSVPAGTINSLISPRAELIGQRTSKAGKLLDVYRWEKFYYTEEIIRIA